MRLTFGQRLRHLVVVLLLVTVATSLLTAALPGDPVEVLVPYGSDELREEVRLDLELDAPAHERYLSWLGDLATGDLGSYYGVSSARPVRDAVFEAAPVSLLLMLYAQLVALALAVPLGVVAARRAGRPTDRVINTAAFGLLAIPNFALGLLLAYYLGARWKLLPVSGYTQPTADLVDHVRRMVLPVVSLAAGQVALYLRILRSDMIATLGEDYITMATAKGLPMRLVLLRHALKPSSLALLTIVGINVGTLIGGAVIIEVIFQLPGLGLLLYQATVERQYIALQSLIALFSVAYVLLNFAVDGAYARLDPRTRHGI